MCYMRKQVAVRALRQNLSVHLRRVKKGEVLEVTERGQPVAILSPLPEAMTPLGRLMLEGRVMRPATGRTEDLPPPLKIKLGKPLTQILDELREDTI